MENEEFLENKRIGQFAINVYEAIEIYQNDPDSEQNVQCVFNMADDDEILMNFFNNEYDLAIDGEEKLSLFVVTTLGLYEMITASRSKCAQNKIAEIHFRQTSRKTYLYLI